MNNKGKIIRLTVFIMMSAKINKIQNLIERRRRNNKLFKKLTIYDYFFSNSSIRFNNSAFCFANSCTAFTRGTTNSA
jgi:hypothetical protein